MMTTSNRQILILKIWSEKLTWAFGSGELNIRHLNFSFTLRLAPYQWQPQIGADATFEPASFFLDCVEAEFGKFVSKGFVWNFLVFEHYKRRTLKKKLSQEMTFHLNKANGL